MSGLAGPRSLCTTRCGTLELIGRVRSVFVDPGGRALASGLIEPRKEPGQGAQGGVRERGERPGVGDEVAPELFAQAPALGGDHERLDPAVAGICLAFQLSAG